MKENNQYIKWLDKAEDDLSFAKDVLEDGKNRYDYICWLAEQAVEKYLKALLIKNKGRLDVSDKTHNLVYLASALKSFNFNLENFQKDLRWFSEIYLPARYPDTGEVEFSKVDAQEAIEKAQEIIEFIKSQI